MSLILDPIHLKVTKNISINEKINMSNMSGIGNASWQNGRGCRNPGIVLHIDLIIIMWSSSCVHNQKQHFWQDIFVYNHTELFCNTRSIDKSFVMPTHQVIVSKYFIRVTKIEVSSNVCFERPPMNI